MIDHETAENALDGVSPSGARPPATTLGDSGRRAGSRDPGAGSSPLDADEDASSPTERTFDARPIGDYLRRQRMLRGISVEELSSLTRIPLRSLERLENGEFDGETDGFVRGFVRTVALALGLDAEDTISRMLKEPAAGAWERHQPGRRAKQWFAVIALFVMASLGLLLLQAGWRVLVGSGSEDPDRKLIVWRDPVRSLAEATGAEVDPAGEIDPSQGTRLETLGLEATRADLSRSVLEAGVGRESAVADAER
jgi:transcriptional regulator with XRE-family HTH domain